MSGQVKRVLVFAPPDDAHARIVIGLLEGRCETTQLDLHTAVGAALDLRPGDYVSADSQIMAAAGTTIWWRRTGAVPRHPGMSPDENRLRAEETTALVIGALLSLDVRWVDHPGTVQVAEHTLLQLAAAAACGATTPVTVATNMPSVAEGMAEQMDLVAKATSPGVGIAPFADYFDATAIHLLPNAPTLLQKYTAGSADLRIVVVGHRAFGWRRARRAGEPFDWRDPDPRGAEFARYLVDAELELLAVAITARLGLTFSAQDWVETAEGPVFLEANPVGQWLFLNTAETSVAPALADHLLDDSPDV